MEDLYDASGIDRASLSDRKKYRAFDQTHAKALPFPSRRQDDFGGFED